MSHILIVTPVPLLPADAGNRARIKTMVDALEHSGHTVVILHSLREIGDIDAMRERWGDAYIPVEYNEGSSALTRRVRRLRRRIGLRRAYTWGLDSWYDPALDEHIQNAIQQFKINVVLAEYVFFSKALEVVPDRILKVLDTHDRFANRHRRFLDAGLEPAWYSCTLRAERRGIQRADLVLAIQDTEAAYFETLTNNEVATVGHMVELSDRNQANTDETSYSDSTHYPENQTVLIVGSANSINVDSTRWYLNEVWPLVQQQLPSASLRIAGGVCEELTTCEESVLLLGRLDDLVGEYETSQVVVNPMLAGTGLKIKTIEAMGWGKAVISTPSGAEGLGDATGEALLQASSTDEMTKASVFLLQNPAECAKQGQAALSFATRYNKNCMATFTRVLTH